MEQFELLRLALLNLERLNAAYAVVGSWGSSIYGEPRFTNDIDIVVDLSESAIPAFCALFPTPDFYWNESAIRDAVRNRSQFNILHPSSGNKIDFMIPEPTGWRRDELVRRRKVQLLPGPDGFDGFIAAPEDVILGKLWYHSQGGGERHLRDIAGMLRVSGHLIDYGFVSGWAQELGCEGAWQQVLALVGGPK